MKIKKINLIINLLIPILVGGISGFLVKDYTGIYETLNKPPLSPPDYIFSIVWPVLYLLMGVSSYLIYNSEDSANKEKAFFWYGIQLILNFMWSIVFFRFENYTLALAILIVLIMSIIMMITSFSKVNKLAGWLQIFYLIWCVFALYLNYFIAFNN